MPDRITIADLGGNVGRGTPDANSAYNFLRTIGSYIAPDLTSYLTEPEPAYRGAIGPGGQLIPGAGGKVPSTEDPRTRGMQQELVDLASNLVPVGGAAKAATALTPLLAGAARRAPALAGIGEDVARAPLSFWAHHPDIQILPGDLRASTRFPTAKGAPDDPLKYHLNIGIPELRNTPGVAEHNIGLLSSYPGFAHLKGMSDEDAVRAFLDQAKGNLNYLYEKAPPIMRERSPLWYEGANRFASALAERYGIPRQSASAATASLSPQMDWFKNASLAERVGDTLTSAAAGRPMTSDMVAAFKARPNLAESEVNQALFRRIKGKTLDQLTDPLDQALWIRLYDEANNPRNYRMINPEGMIGDFARNKGGEPSEVGWGALGEIAKAVQSYKSGGDMSIISPVLGTKHKVRSFYNNIELPNDPRFGDVTADTHQVAAALMRPLSGSSPEVQHNLMSGGAAGSTNARASSVTGVQGTYPLTVEATREAARDVGLLPRAMQSATWEPVRELFPAKFKTDINNARVDAVWKAVDRGELSVPQARDKILEIAGGIGEPSWARPGVVFSDPRTTSTYR